MKNIFELLSVLFFLMIGAHPLWAQWEQTELESGTVTSFTQLGPKVFAATSDFHGVFLSPNGGTVWTKVGLTNSSIQALAVSSDGQGNVKLFAGTYGGVFLSSNNGNNWSKIDSGFTNTDVYALATSGVNLFAGTPSGVYRSTDNGRTWITASSGLTFPWVVAFAVLHSGVAETTLFAGTFGGGVFLSTDNGADWTEVNAGLGNYFIKDFAVTGTSLFVGTWGGGVFRSDKGGTSWNMTNNGITNLRVWSLAASGSNLFAGTEAGIFLSTDNGINWTSIGTGLANNWVTAVTVSGAYVFAGTPGVGVWRRPLSEIITGIADNQEGTPQQFVLHQNYPNPFNPTTTINYEVPTQAHVALKVYNVLGNEIATLVNEVQQVGYRSVLFRTDGLPGGVYFYSLKAGAFIQTKKLLLVR